MASLVRDGIGLLKTDGLEAVLRTAKTFCANEIPLLVRYHGRVARYHLRSGSATPHPWATISVDPFDIEYTNKAEPVHGGENSTEFDSIDDAGTIRGGDWDRRLEVRFDEMPKPRAVRRRFEDDISWEETELWDNLVAVIDTSGSIDGCRSRQELRRRYREIDELYRNIAEHGFLPRSEFAPWYDVRDRLDIPKVNVGRDGTLIKASGSGYHRIAIARVLEVPVPVRVLVRHDQWQAVRERYARADSLAELHPQLHRFVGHPDLRDVTPESGAENSSGIGSHQERDSTMARVTRRNYNSQR